MAAKRPAKKAAAKSTEPVRAKRVEARWVSTQPHYLPQEGRIIFYGETLMVTAEQLEQDRRLQAPDEPYDEPPTEGA